MNWSVSGSPLLTWPRESDTVGSSMDCERIEAESVHQNQEQMVMKKSRFTDEQIAFALHQAESRTPHSVARLIRSSQLHRGARECCIAPRQV